MSYHGLAAVFAIALLLASCARSPRTPETTKKNARPLTRSATPEAPPGNRPVQSPTAAEPGCTIALQLPDTLLDCTFTHCPGEFLKQLLAQDNMSLDEDADSTLGIFAHRPTPPRTIRLATCSPAGNGWEIEPSGDKTTGLCQGISAAGSRGPISGVAVRRTLGKRGVRVRP
jgi:hypothetical protein